LIKVAHISDLHFFHYEWTLSALSPKCLLGNINFLLNRRKSFFHERLQTLATTFKNEEITHVIITGDLTTTSTTKEFSQAKKFIQHLEDTGLEVFTIPGNHDTYTQKDYKNRTFYNYFPSKWQDHDLKHEGFTTHQLNTHWHLVGLDTTIATPLFCSSGLFSHETEKNIDHFFAALDPNKKVILINHFPFLLKQSKRKRLKRHEALKNLILKSPQIKIYCHGHTHKQSLIDLQHQKLPITINSGCTPHNTLGFWHKLYIVNNKLLIVETFNWKDHKWQSIQKQNYALV
jgi:3',5'-cyclic AMP phosphodiesterase CpdA